MPNFPGISHFYHLGAVLGTAEDAVVALRFQAWTSTDVLVVGRCRCTAPQRRTAVSTADLEKRNPEQLTRTQRRNGNLRLFFGLSASLFFGLSASLFFGLSASFLLLSGTYCVSRKLLGYLRLFLGYLRLFFVFYLAPTAFLANYSVICVRIFWCICVFFVLSSTCCVF